MAGAKGDRFVALLRAVNVGGTNVLKMDVLRKRFASWGYTDVQTVIQSGNVVFTATGSAAKVEADLEKRMSELLGRPSVVFVLTHDELVQAARHNPFDPERTGKDVQSQLLFLDKQPNAGSVAELAKKAKPEYEFSHRGRVFYYAYGKEWGGKRRAIDFEKALGARGTARTSKVVAKLIALTG